MPAPDRHASGRARAAATLAATAAAAAPAALAALLRPPGTGDYALHAPPGGDNAAPAIALLAHLHVGAAAAVQPMMGLTSLLVRAPAAAVAGLLGHPLDGLGYSLGALLCLLPLAVLLGLRLSDRGSDGAPPPTRRAPLLAALGGAVVLVAPAVREALASGHPEEVLAATLACAAVLAAERGHPAKAGVCLGLAAGTKQWGLIAAVPVLCALPSGRSRARAGLAALAAAALTCGALPLLDPAASARAAALVGGAHTVNLASLWWPLGHRLAGLGAGAAGAILPTARDLPIGRTTALVLGVTVATALLELARRHASARGRAVHPLAALAILGAARCAADPWDLHYYWVAVLIPLAVLETVVHRRVPAKTVVLGLILRLDFTLSVAPGIHVAAIAATLLAVAGLLLRAPEPHAAAPSRPRRGPLKLAVAPSDH